MSKKSNSAVSTSRQSKLFRDFAKRRLAGESVDVDEFAQNYLQLGQSDLEDEYLSLQEEFPEILEDLIPIEYMAGNRKLVKVDNSEGRLFAVRIGNAATQLESAVNLNQEAEALADLDHPQIVKIVDANVFEDRPFLVMEWVEGERWADLEQSQVDVVTTAVGVLEALNHVHSRGYVHRDVKPENIIVNNLTATLIDFDAVDTIDNEVPRMRGTPGFWSPQQASGKPPQPSDDVYSLGVAIHHRLTGESDRFGETQSYDGIDGRLIAILLKATQQKPRLRYQTAREMQSDLIDWVDGRTPKAAKERQGDLLKRLGLVAAAVCLCMLGGWFLANQFQSSSDRTAFDRRLTADAASFDLETNRRSVVFTTEPAASHVFVFPLDASGEPIQSKGVDAGLSPAQLDLEPGEYWVTVVAPDGRWIEVIRTVPTIKQMPQYYRSVSWGGVVDENGELVEVAVDEPREQVKLAPIKVIEPSLVDMIRVGDIWVENMATPLASGASEYHNALEECERLGCLIASADQIRLLQQLEGTREWSRTTTGVIHNLANGRVVAQTAVAVCNDNNFILSRFGRHNQMAYRKCRNNEPMRLAN